MEKKIIKTIPEKEKIGEIIKIILFDDKKIKLKIPLFQRDYVWNTKDETIPNLLYSLKNGFPIGNLTMWSKPLGGSKSENILIDGLQRTFSIVNILSEPWKYISHNLHKEEYQRICSDDVKIPEVINDETKRIEHRISDKMLRQNNKLKEFTTLKEAKEYIKNYNASDKNEENRKRDEYSLKALDNIINWVLNELEETEIIVNYIDGATEEQIVEIFTLMNSNGKKLNKFEKFSAHWSLTPIKTNNLDSDFLRLIKDRNIQYCETLSKLYPNDSKNKYVNKCEENLREIGEDVIPSDYLSSFLYFLFRNKKYNLKDVYISNNRLIDNEVSIFLLMNFLESSNPKEKWEFKSFGEKLSEIIKKDKDFTQNSINELLKTIEIIEKKFELLEFMNSFSKNKDDSKTLLDKLKISTHFINSLINQGVSFFDDLKSLSNETIQLKLLETKIETAYSFGASPAEVSIRAYKDKFLVKNYSNEGKENLFNSLQNKIFPKERTKKSFSDIDKILTLYTHSIDISAKKESIHFDHIFPKSIIEKMKINDIELINLINSYANSQILSEELNISKGNNFIPEKLQYDNLINNANFIEKLNNCNFSKEKYKELIQQLKEIKNNKWKLPSEDDLNKIQSEIKNILKIRLELLNEVIKNNIFKIS